MPQAQVTRKKNLKIANGTLTHYTVKVSQRE